MKPGDIIAEYQLEQKIASGEFGEVWKARHSLWHERVVAIKFATNSYVIDSIKREAKILHKLRHPNIIEVYTANPYHDLPYVVMEYVEGTNLREIIERGGLKPEEVKRILLQILSALEYAHAQGAIHGDLKPENILISDKGELKLADFGLGRLSAEVAKSIQISIDSEPSEHITGTLAYMSPEQLEGSEIDGRADLYSTAIVMFELLTGRRPHGVELPSEIVDGVPKDFDRIFARAYCHLSRRYKTAGEMADEIKLVGIEQKRVCPECGRLFAPDVDYCTHCSTYVEEMKKEEAWWVCRECGRSYPPQLSRCPRCETEKIEMEVAEPIKPAKKVRKPVFGIVSLCSGIGMYISPFLFCGLFGSPAEWLVFIFMFLFSCIAVGAGLCSFVFETGNKKEHQSAYLGFSLGLLGIIIVIVYWCGGLK